MSKFTYHAVCTVCGTRVPASETYMQYWAVPRGEISQRGYPVCMTCDADSDIDCFDIVQSNADNGERPNYMRIEQ